MKTDPLLKLFASAAKAPREESDRLPVFTQERIFRNVLAQPESEPSFIPVFRWGFAVSMVTAGLALALNAERSGPTLFEQVEGQMVSDLIAYYP